MKYILIILSALFVFYGCKTEPEEIVAPYQFKEYYYPIENLRQGKVYVYESVNDSVSGYYLYLINQGGYLIGTTYNADLEIEQIITEDVLSNGTSLHRFRLCEHFPDNPDICQPVDVDVESPAVFPFEMKDSSSVFLYDVSWTGLMDSMDYKVVRNRHFMGYEQLEWNGKTYDGVKFGIREEITVGRQEIGYQTFKAFTEEHYAKGVGLVHSKKNIDNTIGLEFKLAEITNMKTLEGMLK